MAVPRRVAPAPWRGHADRVVAQCDARAAPGTGCCCETGRYIGGPAMQHAIERQARLGLLLALSAAACTSSNASGGPSDSSADVPAVLADASADAPLMAATSDGACTSTASILASSFDSIVHVGPRLRAGRAGERMRGVRLRLPERRAQQGRVGGVSGGSGGRGGNVHRPLQLPGVRQPVLPTGPVQLALRRRNHRRRRVRVRGGDVRAVRGLARRRAVVRPHFVLRCEPEHARPDD